MNDEVQKSLETYSNLFSSAGELNPMHGALRDFYGMLRSISAGKLLSVSDTLDGAGAENHLPVPLRTLGGLARNAFCIRNPHDMAAELRQMLDHLEIETAWRQLPEVRLLISMGHDRLKALQNSEPGRFSCRLAPSLELDVIEEGASGPNVPFQKTLLTLVWFYEGKAPACDVNLIYKSEGGIDARAEGQEQERGEWRVTRVAEGVVEGGTCTSHLLLQHNGSGKLQYYLEHINYLPDETYLQSDLYEFRLEPPESPQRTADANPFIPDAPLHSDARWHLVQGHHPQIVDRILSELRKSPRLQAVRGLRRSGKTTVLSRVCQKLNDQSDVLPIYVNVYTWWLELTHLKKEIDSPGLLYELADATLRVAERFNLPTPQGDDFLGKFEKITALDVSKFKKFVNIFYEETNRKPVFLLDDLDSWLKVEEFPEGSSRFLVHIRELVEQNALCYVILSHTWTGSRWDSTLYREGILAGYRLEMLDKQSVAALLELVPAVTTAMAQELLWRLTGGWQGLLQLVLYLIHEELPRSGGRVDTLFVKRATRALLTSEDNRLLILYLLESFRSDELSLLRYLIEERLVDAETSVISGLRFNGSDASFDTPRFIGGDVRLSETLSSLMEKEVIESLPPAGLRLRVGFLSYRPILILLDARV